VPAGAKSVHVHQVHPPQLSSSAHSLKVSDYSCKLVQQRLWDSCTGVVHPRSAWQQSQECWVSRKALKVESKSHLLKCSCCNIASRSIRSSINLGDSAAFGSSSTHINRTGLRCPLAAVDSNIAKVRVSSTAQAAAGALKQCRSLSCRLEALSSI